MQQRTGRATRTARWMFAIASVLVLLYALNIALGMLAVKFGYATRRLGDVGEFVLVLSCMAFFVAGLIADEPEPATDTHEEGTSNPLQGGEQ